MERRRSFAYLILLRFISLFCAATSTASCITASTPSPGQASTPSLTKYCADYSASYMAVGPNVFRPNESYRTLISVSGANQICPDIEVSTTIRNSRNETIVSNLSKGKARDGRVIEVIIDKVPAYPFPTGESDNDIYYLYIRGQWKLQTHEASTVLFENQTQISLDLKDCSLFIQTDKAIYKPGSEVKFRIVAIKADLKPYPAIISAYIEDPNQNRIKELSNISLSKNGVYSGSFKLSTHPPLGDWKIVLDIPQNIHPFGGSSTTTTGSQRIERAITVSGYILPKFSVETSSVKQYITAKEGLEVLVKALYTYNKGVAGALCKVVLSYPYPIWWGPASSNGETQKQNSSIERTTKLDGQGSAIVSFTNKELVDNFLFNPNMSWPQSLNILALVTEDLTGIVQNSTNTVTVYPQDLKLELVGLEESICPGYSYHFLVALKRNDDTPTKPSARTVQLTTHFYSYPPNGGQWVWWGGPNERQHDEMNVTLVQLNENGTAIVELNTPTNCSSANIMAVYDPEGRNNFNTSLPSAISTSFNPQVRISPNDRFLRITSPESYAQNSLGSGGGLIFSVDQTITFGVESASAGTTIVCLIIARGKIVFQKSIRAGENNSWNITFKVTSDMAPRSRICAYTIGNGNEILVDAKDFKVNGMFINQVSISPDKTNVQPGNSVNFTLKSNPGSDFFMLAVDQSVLLLKAGNDITTDLVEQQIAQYDTSTNQGTGVINDLWWWRPTGTDATTIFQNSGLVVITNAFLYKYRPQISPAVSGSSQESMGVRNDDSVPSPDALNGGRASSPASAPSSGGDLAIQVRSNFSETWIWYDALQIGASGTLNYALKAPDTITSFVCSAFAVNQNDGIGVAPIGTKVTIFRPFFIRLELPYSVKRGEQLALQVLIFNYMDTDQQVTVTLKYTLNESGFEFVTSDGKILKPGPYNRDYNSRKLTVSKNGGSGAVYFPIVPTKIGQVLLSLEARTQSNMAGDALEQNLLVVPEGYRVDRNIPFVADLSGGNNTFERAIKIDWPQNFVPDSRNVQIDLIGDLMGPVLSSVQSLVQMPYGCGEQNMVVFSPNIVILGYLYATHRNDSSLVPMATEYCEAGYQRQLNYRRLDNSFSAFGQSDPQGSTWLTAFTIRCFHEAKRFIYIDDNIIASGAKFILSQQTDEGSFAEHGQVIHKPLQGGATSGGIALTAYVFATLLEIGQQNQKALTYLEGKLDSIGGSTTTTEVTTTTYELALIAYALHLANSSRRVDTLRMLEARQINGSDGTVHWVARPEAPPKNDPIVYIEQSPPADIEATAYCLLVYVIVGNLAKALPIVRWLTSERNSLGGFTSTQDTVVGIKALSAYAEKTYSKSLDLVVAIIVNGKSIYNTTINEKNALVLQSFDMVDNMDSPITIKANGSGVCFVQVQYSYYLKELRRDDPFYCVLDILAERQHFKIQFCCNYSLSGQSNMALAELNTPSGYTFEQGDIPSIITGNKSVQRVDLENGDTRADIYLNPIGKELVCFGIYITQAYQVADQKPAYYSMIDYYDPVKQIKGSYGLPGNNKTTTLPT